MGLFRSKPKISDRIWQSEVLKEKDIVKSIQTALVEQDMPLAVYHFRDSGIAFDQLFIAQQIKVHRVNSLTELDTTTPEGWRSRADVLLMDSHILPETVLERNHRWVGKTLFRLFLLERYPIPGPDDRVLALAGGRNDISAPTAFMALENPWLRSILGERVEAILDQLDSSEEEVIQHPLLSRSIRNAQEKIAEELSTELPQASLAAWLQYNRFS